MKKDTYKKYITYTLSTYNKANKRVLLNNLFANNIAAKRDMQTSLFDKEVVFVDENNIDESINECIEKKDLAIKEYEMFQYERNYKYAVICSTDDFDDALEKIKAIPEYSFNEEECNLFDELKEPQKVTKDELINIIFNKKFEAIHPITGEELYLHYPVSVIIHKKNNLFEIRFDTVKRLFTGGERDQMLYINLVDEVINYFMNDLNIRISPLALDFMVDLMKKEEIEDVKLISQYMNLASGGKAQLAVGNNEEYVLPIIGELKNIMGELKEELEKNVKIKDALEQFIYEKEETTDYPWIEVLFMNKEGIKIRNNHVKFTFEYMNKEYTLITYYYNETLTGMERMNDVTRFIGENISREQ